MADDDRAPAHDMAQTDARAAGQSVTRGGTAPGASEPKPNWLGRIIGRGPSARKQLGEAVAALLGTALVALAAIGGLVIWHLVRRGRIIRERLDPPRPVRMPEPHELMRGPHDDRHDDVPPS